MIFLVFQPVFQLSYSNENYNCHVFFKICICNYLFDQNKTLKHWLLWKLLIFQVALGIPHQNG